PPPLLTSSASGKSLAGQWPPPRHPPPAVPGHAADRPVLPTEMRFRSRMAPSLRRPNAVTTTAPRHTRAPRIVYACSLIDLDTTSLPFYPLGAGLTVTGFPVSRTDRVSGNAFSVRDVTRVSAPFRFVTETHSLNGMSSPAPWRGPAPCSYSSTRPACSRPTAP